MSFLIFIAIVVIMIVLSIKKGHGSGLSGVIPVSNVLSHWNHFFRFLSFSTEVFYVELEKTLLEHQMPHSEISRTQKKEGGMFSAKREYLRIKHGDIVFEVCAAPFGKDFFISWWIYETESHLRKILKNTKAGKFLEVRAAKRTFFQIDEEDMFRSFVHECILEAIDRISNEKGFLKLTDSERAFRLGGL